MFTQPKEQIGLNLLIRSVDYYTNHFTKKESKHDTKMGTLYKKRKDEIKTKQDIPPHLFLNYSIHIFKKD